MRRKDPGQLEKITYNESWWNLGTVISLGIVGAYYATQYLTNYAIEESQPATVLLGFSCFYLGARAFRPSSKRKDKGN